MAKVTFENAMKQLENIVHELESGNLSLDDSIKKFEEGIKLSNYCFANVSTLNIIWHKQDNNSWKVAKT